MRLVHLVALFAGQGVLAQEGSDPASDTRPLDEQVKDSVELLRRVVDLEDEVKFSAEYLPKLSIEADDLLARMTGVYNKLSGVQDRHAMQADQMSFVTKSLGDIGDLSTWITRLDLGVVNAKNDLQRGEYIIDKGTTLTGKQDDKLHTVKMGGAQVATTLENLMRRWRDEEVGQRTESVEDQRMKTLQATASEKLTFAKSEAQRIMSEVEADEHQSDMQLVALKGALGAARGSIGELERDSIQDGGRLQALRDTEWKNTQLEQQSLDDLGETHTAASMAARREDAAQLSLRQMEDGIRDLASKNSQLASALHTLDEDESVEYNRADAGAKIVNEKLSRVTIKTKGLVNEMGNAVDAGIDSIKSRREDAEERRRAEENEGKSFIEQRSQAPHVSVIGTLVCLGWRAGAHL